MTVAGWQWPGSRIVRVLDGDTVDALVSRDLGFGGTASFTVRLRLARINAPALNTKAGKAARDWLVDLLEPDEPWLWDITTLKAYKYSGPTGSAGEYMAEIKYHADLISDLIVTAGHATYWDGRGARPNDGGPTS
jgi:endonuclease YncB( thermonuclease family)